MKKPRLSTILLILLILIGLGVMLYPVASDIYCRWEAGREIAKYNQVAEAEKKDYSALWEAAEEYNRQLAEDDAFSVTATSEYADYVAQFLNPLGTGMMGYVDIPAIGIHIPIYQGTEERALQAGAGYWLGTSLPTGGPSTHCVLTAHNGLVKAKMFTDLDQLVEGDTFSLSILDRVLTYEVDQILITEPDDFDPLRIVEGEDYVTLYTCTPYGINTHRLLVRGHRIEGEAQTGLVQSLTAGMTWWQILLMILAFLLLALLIFFIVKRMIAKKKHGNHKEEA